MTDSTHRVYQSGEKVVVAGLYEVVGAGYAYNLQEHTVRSFQPGEYFPDYVGRAVCWHLLKETPPDPPAEPPRDSTQDDPPMHTVWQPVKHHTK